MLKQNLPCMHTFSVMFNSFAVPWFVTHQAPLYMGFSWQAYQSGLPSPPPGDLPDPEIEPKSPVYSALSGRLFTTEPPGKPRICFTEPNLVSNTQAFTGVISYPVMIILLSIFIYKNLKFKNC